MQRLYGQKFLVFSGEACVDKEKGKMARDSVAERDWVMRGWQSAVGIVVFTL